VRIGKEEEADLTFSNCQIGGKAHWHGDKTRPQPTEGLAGAASNLARGRAEQGGRTQSCIQVVPDLGPWWCGARKAASRSCVTSGRGGEARSKLHPTHRGPGRPPASCIQLDTGPGRAGRSHGKLHPGRA
jgi:hypothetical protein